MFRLPFTVLVAMATACATASSGDSDTDSVDPQDETAARLADWLEGDYDSADQEERDYNYYAISLRMCTVELAALGERVLYVEQAMLEDPSRPYRQRLYVVEPIDDETARSAVWQAIDETDESALVGMCDDPDSFDFSADQFEERSGCAVEMTWTDGAYIGGTDETSCESSLNGASYATAAVTLSPTMLTSWDRGFDDDGEQVWGAVDGPYEFVRRSTAPEED